MGHKIHPKVFRLSTIYTWDSKWFAPRRDYIQYLSEDVRLREYLLAELTDAGVDSVKIDRNRDKISINIISAKPGFIIGRAGAGIEELKKKLKKKFYRGRRVNLQINIKEVDNPSLSARIVAQQVAKEIENRLPYRRSIKMAVERVMKSGAKGAKVMVGGRLNGADIARKERVSQGSIPLHNLRADVDFARVMARTIYGAVGVKVWIYKGEVFETEDNKPKAGDRVKRKSR